MLNIIEVPTEEKFKSLRLKENMGKDYLYILKYDGILFLSDNGKDVPIKGFNQVTLDELENKLQEIKTQEIQPLKEELEDLNTILDYMNGTVV